jgi:small subunit ribosomal protein S16
MLKIRLQRIGRKHEPAFRLVLTDSKNSTKSGRFLEVLGNYDARHGEQAVFKAERISYWMGTGAQVSDTVHNLLVDKKIITGKKVNTLPLKKAIMKDVPASAPAAATSEAKPAEVKTVDVAETPAEPVVVEASAVEETAPVSVASDANTVEAK